MSVHSDWLIQLKEYQNMVQSQGATIELPSPTMLELKLEYVEIIAGKKMVAKVPFQKRFTNPVGLYQGGVLTAAMDDVFGPLSYSAASRPCMTLSMNITFLKAFTEKMGHCLIDAQILQQTKSFIFMRADILSPEGELIAHGETHVTILRDDQLQKVKV
jgi:uncharacterized protein (TIGR00369 family)